MDKSKFEVVRINYNDLRFGPVDVMNDTENNILIMVKKEEFTSVEKFKLQVKQTKYRQSFKSNNIHKIVGVEIDEDNLKLEIFYVYPNDDLFERIEDFRDPDEMLKFLKDIIQAIYFLQKKHLIHGNLRPEYISYDHETNNYQVLDRLVDRNSPEKTQMNNINKKECLYLCPIFFSFLMKTSKKKQNFFKSEIFTIGLIFLSVVYNEDDIQNLYDFQLGIFDKVKFHNLIKFLDERVFIEGKARKIFQFIQNNMLSYEESERKMPFELLLEIKKEFGMEFETYENEENNQKRSQKSSIFLNTETFISYYPVSPENHKEDNLFSNKNLDMKELKKTENSKEYGEFDANMETMNIENYIKKDYDIKKNSFFEENSNKNIEVKKEIKNDLKEEMIIENLYNLEKLCHNKVKKLYSKAIIDEKFKYEQQIIEEKILKEHIKNEVRVKEVIEKPILNKPEVKKKLVDEKIIQEQVIQENLLEKPIIKEKIEEKKIKVEGIKLKEPIKEKKEKIKKNKKKKKKKKLFDFSSMYKKVAKNINYGFYEEKKQLETIKIKEEIIENEIKTENLKELNEIKIVKEIIKSEIKTENFKELNEIKIVEEIIKNEINIEIFKKSNEIKMVESTHLNLKKNDKTNQKKKYKVCDIYNFKQEFPDEDKEFLKIQLEINNVVKLDENVENRRKKTLEKKRQKNFHVKKEFHNMEAKAELYPKLKISNLNNSIKEIKNAQNKTPNFKNRIDYEVKSSNLNNLPITNTPRKNYKNIKREPQRKNNFGSRNKSPIRIKRITKEEYEKSKGNKNVRSISPIIKRKNLNGTKIKFIETIKKKGGFILKKRKSVVRVVNKNNINLDQKINDNNFNKKNIIYNRENFETKKIKSNKNFYNQNYNEFEKNNKFGEKKLIEKNVKMFNSYIVNNKFEKIKEFNDKDPEVNLNELQQMAIKSGRNIYVYKNDLN